MNPVFEQMSRIGIIPVIALDDAGDAAPLAEALLNGGLSCAEVTFRTAAAEETIRKISEDYPEMLVGAGTVLTTEQADSAVAAGAKFIVSPGLNPVTVKYCQAKGVPVIPGIMTPSEIELALSLGLTEVKFFPAEAAGGVKMIKQEYDRPQGRGTAAGTGNRCRADCGEEESLYRAGDRASAPGAA